MEITKTFYPPDRAAWRNWLQAHYRLEDEIWLVYYRKETGRHSISYSDAVEEALCFGWIDGLRKTLDEDRYTQRFTPRRPGSKFSQTNLERLSRLIAAGLVMTDVMDDLGEIRPENFEFPADIVAALKANPDAWAHFQTFSPPYQRIRIAYIEHARQRPEIFPKRLNHFLKMTARGKQFGYGIEMFY